MDIRQLEYFLVLCEQEHMSGSADFLGISQPALSKSIANLEKELDTRLFDRTGNSIRLNEQGRSFAVYARKALNDLQEGRHSLRQSRYDICGELRITCHTFADCISDCIIAYSGLNPKVKFLVTQGRQKDDDSENTADFLLSLQSEVSNGSSDSQIWQAMQLFEEEYVIAVSPNYRALSSENGALQIADLKNEFFVVTTNATMYYVDITHVLCRMAGFTPHIFCSTDDFVTKMRLVDSGRAICIIPECCKRIARLLSPGIQFFRISDHPVRRAVFLQHRKESLMTEAALDFWNFCADYYGHSDFSDPVFQK